jgi:SAM-dependent methyltransferase
MPGDDRRRPTSQGFVDYDRVANRYQQCRALSAEVLDRWASAVRPYLPPGPCRVVDVGAGTGIFAAAWSQWTAATVVAVEPSAGMVQTGRVAHPTVGFVRGVAEALPLPDEWADVVWVSTALHHFLDVDQAIAEFARVLTPDGRVLVRTYVPGRTERDTWASAFPERMKAKWEARVYSEDRLTAIFGAGGFAVTGSDDVLEWTESYGASADWMERMRHADSFLTALTDEEIAEVVAFLRSQPARIRRLELALLVFTRR